MLIKPWVKMPTKWILEGRLTKHFTWSTSGTVNRSNAIAALQLWICLITRSNEYPAHGDEDIECYSDATYNALMTSTGLSRALVAKGLRALEALNLIEIERNGRTNRYRFVEYNSARDWCKLPARALYVGRSSEQSIRPFQHFQKRSIVELDALKMYLYLAAVRPNTDKFSKATYETIHTKLGIIEKRINRTNSFLITSGLLQDVRRLLPDGEKKNRPNGYFLAGFSDLFVGLKRKEES